jgi:glycopeptide antibiotics resistance protein
VPRPEIMRYAAPAARLAYVAVILLATLTDLQPELVPADIRMRFQRAFSLEIRPADAIDAARNVVLFAGWGLVWAATSRRGLALRVAAATLTGTALSVFVETVQLTSVNRRASILDVATNSVGAFTGALALVLAIVAMRALRTRRSFVGVPALLFAAGYGAAAALEVFIPLRQSRPLRGVYGGFGDRFRQIVELYDPATLFELPLLYLPLFAPAGAFAVAALVEAGWRYRTAWPVVAIAGATLVPAVELLAAGAAHPIHAGSTAMQVLGVALGAAAAARWLPGLAVRLRGRARPAALLAAYVTLLVLWTWRPFLPVASLDAFVAQFRADRFIPLSAHAERFEFFSVVDVMRQFALLLPVGGLLAVWPLRRDGWLAGPLPGLYLAVLLESGQLLIAFRYFDVTDAIVGSAAVLVGWAAVRQAGYQHYGELARPPSGG